MSLTQEVSKNVDDVNLSRQMILFRRIGKNSNAAVRKLSYVGTLLKKQDQNFKPIIAHV